MQQKDIIYSSIRIPIWLRDKVKQRAENERRSFNAMLNILLEKAVQEEKETANP